ncbi:MAG TPA: hypothetical protein VF432_23555 [Thermoanaerobaculia bacterium]
MQTVAGRAFIAVLVLLAASACPSNRRAQNSFTGGRHPGTIPIATPVTPALTVITDLRAPESVLHDRERDVYYISNIHGGMLDVDGNGFISRVDPRTMRVELHWIAGGRNGVRLDGPKGMAVAGDTLYVSDILAVRKFDRRTGAPLGAIELPGASFLNDIATDGRNVYVSDTGIAMGPGLEFLETGTDAIWKIAGGRAEKIASGRELRHPNGLDFAGGKLRVVTFGSNELYELDGDRRRAILRFPGEQLDGLVHLADGSPVVTSWEADQIFAANDDGIRAVLASIPSPADIGYDTKRRLLLVPRPMNNQVTIHSLSE